MGRLEAKRSLVTGAGSGIGAASALRLSAEGSAVTLVDVDVTALEAVTQEILASGATALALQADVRVEAQVQQAVDEAVQAFGGLDVAHINAAVQLFGQDDRAHELDLAVWQRTLDVNLTGAFLTAKHTIRAMLQSGGGSVVLTGSPTGLRGSARGFDAYSASKAGVHGLMRVLAADYAADGIRVNTVVPGFTDTPLVGEIMADSQARGELLRDVPVGRPGTTAEVAAMIAFLASDEAEFCTGGLYMVDGGMTAV